MIDIYSNLWQYLPEISLLCIFLSFVGDNGFMKYPKEKKYGSNSDERETFVPEAFDLEKRTFETTSR